MTSSFKVKYLLLKKIICILLVGITVTTSAPRKAEANPLIAYAVLGFVCYAGFTCVKAGIHFFQNKAEDKRFLEDRTNLKISNKMKIDVEIQKTMLDPVLLTDLKKLKLLIQSKDGSIRLVVETHLLGGISEKTAVSEKDEVLVSSMEVDAAGLATALACLDRNQKDGTLATFDFVIIQDNEGKEDRFGDPLENYMTVLAPFEITSDTFSNNSKSFEIVDNGFKATVKLE